MNDIRKRKLASAFFNMDIFTPMGLCKRALLILLIFLLLDAGGFDKYTMLLSGTSPSGDPEGAFVRVLAILYIVFYLGAVILTPILLLASGILRVLFYLTEPKNNPSGLCG